MIKIKLNENLKKLDEFLLALGGSALTDMAQPKSSQPKSSQPHSSHSSPSQSSISSFITYKRDMIEEETKKVEEIEQEYKNKKYGEKSQKEKIMQQVNIYLNHLDTIRKNLEKYKKASNNENDQIVEQTIQTYKDLIKRLENIKDDYYSKSDKGTYVDTPTQKKRMKSNRCPNCGAIFSKQDWLNDDETIDCQSCGDWFYKEDLMEFYKRVSSGKNLAENKGDTNMIIRLKESTGCIDFDKDLWRSTKYIKDEDAIDTNDSRKIFRAMKNVFDSVYRVPVYDNGMIAHPIDSEKEVGEHLYQFMVSFYEDFIEASLDGEGSVLWNGKFSSADELLNSKEYQDMVNGKYWNEEEIIEESKESDDFDFGFDDEDEECYTCKTKKRNTPSANRIMWQKNHRPQVTKNYVQKKNAIDKKYKKDYMDDEY